MWPLERENWPRVVLSENSAGSKDFPTGAGVC